MGGILELISNVSEAQRKIEECIKVNGSAPEHNYHYYQWLEEPNKKNIFLKFLGKKGILAQYNKKINAWYLISMPLAKTEEMAMVIANALDFLLKEKKAKKVVLELPPELKKRLELSLKNTEFRIGQNNYVYYWPVFEMKMWDGHKLEGKKWKKIRNIRNRFYRLNKLRIRDSRKIASEKLVAIVKDWLRRRKEFERPLYHRYFNMIACNFKGVDFARTLIVNNEPCSITAGWRIPNSRNYYSGIGIYNYRFDGIGEVANLDDLVFLKKKGFEKVDFGGSGKTLLQFKKKFRPSIIYKTCSFPVFKKN